MAEHSESQLLSPPKCADPEAEVVGALTLVCRGYQSGSHRPGTLRSHRKNNKTSQMGGKSVL